MKNITFLIIILFHFVCNSQSNYSIGFKDGFKYGYCINSNNVGCIPPFASIVVPIVGENSNSYQDGYNRGFKIGMDKYNSENPQQKSSDSQNSNHKTFKQDKPKFLSTDDNEDNNDYYKLKSEVFSVVVDRALDALREERYDDAISDANKLIKLKSDYALAYVIKSNAYFQKKEILNAYNNSVKAYKSSPGSSDAKLIYNYTREKIIQHLYDLKEKSNYDAINYICSNLWYNESFCDRIKQDELKNNYNKEESIENNEFKGNYLFQTTFNNPPVNVLLRKEPNVTAEVIIDCPKSAKVYVIEKTDSIYYKVWVNGHIGYLSNGFLTRK